MGNYTSYFAHSPILDPRFTGLFVLLALWTIVWKGWALWLAARRGEKPWFIILLIVNTVGILEIIYIFAVAKKSDKKAVEPMTPETK